MAIKRNNDKEIKKLNRKLTWARVWRVVKIILLTIPMIFIMSIFSHCSSCTTPSWWPSLSGDWLPDWWPFESFLGIWRKTDKDKPGDKPNEENNGSVTDSASDKLDGEEDESIGDDEYESYTITFYLNEDSSPYFVGETNEDGLLLDFPHQPIDENYAFISWGVVDENWDFKEGVISTTVFNESCNVLAFWKDYSDFTVSFYLEEGASPYFVGTTKGNGILSVFPETPADETRAFVDWYVVDEDGQTLYSISEFTVFKESCNVVAHWEDYYGYSVSFYLDESDNPSSPYFVGVTKGNGRLSALPEVPTREDCYFFAWGRVNDNGIPIAVANIDIVYDGDAVYYAIFKDNSMDDDSTSDGNDGGDDSTSGGDDSTSGDNDGGDDSTSDDNDGGDDSTSGGNDGGDDSTSGDNDGGDDGVKDDWDVTDLPRDEAGYIEYNPYINDTVPEDFYEGRDASKFYISFYIKAMDNGEYAGTSNDRYYFTSDVPRNENDEDGDGYHDATGEPVFVSPYTDYCHSTDIIIDEQVSNFRSLITALKGTVIAYDCLDGHKELYLVEYADMACLQDSEGNYYVIGGSLNGEFFAVDMDLPLYSGITYELMPYDYFMDS